MSDKWICIHLTLRSVSMEAYVASLCLDATLEKTILVCLKLCISNWRGIYMYMYCWYIILYCCCLLSFWWLHFTRALAFYLIIHPYDPSQYHFVTCMAMLSYTICKVCSYIRTTLKVTPTHQDWIYSGKLLLWRPIQYYTCGWSGVVCVKLPRPFTHVLIFLCLCNIVHD